MGFEIVDADEAAFTVSDEQRRKILDDLAAGKLSSEEAVQRLQGN